jgi:hypothetical protein
MNRVKICPGFKFPVVVEVIRPIKHGEKWRFANEEEHKTINCKFENKWVVRPAGCLGQDMILCLDDRQLTPEAISGFAVAVRAVEESQKL